MGSVATGSYLGEGFDDERLDALVLALPVAWGGLVAQYVGRLHRKREGKREVVVYDYVDVNVRMLDRMYRKRLKEYAAQGYKLRVEHDAEDVRGEFVSSGGFAERMAADVIQAVSSLYFASAEVHKQRVALMLPIVEQALARGVDVRVLLPSSADAKPKKAQIIAEAAATLEQMGARERFCEACPNLTVMDKKIVWYGGMGVFAFSRTDEEVLRFVSGEVAGELGLKWEDSDMPHNC